MTKEYTPKEIKNRLSNIGAEIGNIALKYIAELEKKNKEVARKADEAIADKLLITAKYNEVINDLNKENDKLQKENAELKGEIKKWKDEWQEQVQKENDESYARTLQTIQLTKAKEIIEKLLPYAKTGKHDKQDLQSIDRFCESIHEAEQFLKECE